MYSRKQFLCLNAQISVPLPAGDFFVLPDARKLGLALDRPPSSNDGETRRVLRRWPFVARFGCCVWNVSRWTSAAPKTLAGLVGAVE